MKYGVASRLKWFIFIAFTSAFHSVASGLFANNPSFFSLFWHSTKFDYTVLSSNTLDYAHTLILINKPYENLIASNK